MSKRIIETNNAPGAIGPYSQGVIVGNTIYTSGQLGIDITTGEMPESVEEQTKFSISNIKAILEEAGSSMEKVIKMTVFVKDMNDFAKVNEVYKGFFEGNYPARSCVEVSRLPKDALVEIEAIAEL